MEERSERRIATTNLTSVVLPTLGYVSHVSRIHRRRSKLFCHMTLDTTPSAMKYFLSAGDDRDTDCHAVPLPPPPPPPPLPETRSGCASSLALSNVTAAGGRNLGRAGRCR